MNRIEFITATALVLFGAFVLGWFTCWLIGRLTRATPADIKEHDRLTRQLHETERDRDTALARLQEREADLTTRLTTAETELEAAMSGLRESRTEIEELRDYIERKLARR